MLANTAEVASRRLSTMRRMLDIARCVACAHKRDTARSAATLTVFVPDGTASIRDSLVVWLPGLSVVVWYLSVALALLRVSRRQAVSNEGRSSST